MKMRVRAPSKGFRAPRLAERAPFLPPARTAAQRAGWNFQHKVGKDLEAFAEGLAGRGVVEDLWFSYFGEGKERKAGPDLLWIDLAAGEIVVLECKLSLCNCYRQLWLYMAIVKSVFPEFKVSGCVVFKKFREGVVQSGDSEWVFGLGECRELDWDGVGKPVVGILQVRAGDDLEW